MSVWRSGAIGWVAGLVVGCNAVGACEHVFRDPILRVVEVVGVNGTPIPSVTLVGVVVNGRAVEDLPRLTLAPSVGLTFTDGLLQCQVACGFGVAEGTYEFTVGAPGFQDKRISKTARYKTFEGGCPSENSGSTDLSVVLTPTAS